MWLALLFSALCLGYIFEYKLSILDDDSDEADPRPTQWPARIQDFHTKAVQCIVLADYVKCPPYSLEALLGYFVTDHFLHHNQTSPWFIGGLIVRVAFRMGYHRDPSNFPTLSLFDCEMRRRMWSIVLQMDLMISSQAGLPRMIQRSQYDTKEPRNLLDEDFGEGSTALPSSRPDTEYTPMMYVRTRTRVLEVFAQITDLSISSQLPPYSEIMRLDAELLRVRDEACIPFMGLEDIVFDNPNVALQQLYVGRLLLKAQCVLHRHYLVLARADEQYEYSRSTCIKAALGMLRYQRMLFEESRYGGRLWVCRWRIAPLFGHDSLLASTILCLELHQGRSSMVRRHGSEDLPDQLPEGTTWAEIMDSLRCSYRIFLRGSARWDGARKMVQALKIVLGDDLGSTERSPAPSSSITDTIQSILLPEQTMSQFDVDYSQDDSPASMQESFVDDFDWVIAHNHSVRAREIANQISRLHWKLSTCFQACTNLRPIVS